MEPNSETNTNPTPPLSPKTKIDRVAGDSSFQNLMKERAKERTKKDERGVAELAVQITHAEQALAAEIRRRVEADASTREQSRKRVEEVRAQLEEWVREK